MVHIVSVKRLTEGGKSILTRSIPRSVSSSVLTSMRLLYK